MAQSEALAILQAGTDLGWTTDPVTWTVIASLSTPYLMYTFIWTNPEKFKKLCRKTVHPVEMYCHLAHGLKIFQILVVSLWYLSHGSPLEERKSPVLLVLGLILAVLGQVLNVGVYKAIGIDGIFYGSRLGRNVPWCEGFPFNVVKHPQYTGACITITGLMLMVADQAHASAGLFGILASWIGMYVAMMYVEEVY